jgi:O-antigen/teichoic acid export membrane protein
VTRPFGRLGQSALFQAGLAIGAAGLGRIGFNSLIAFGFGSLVFAQYAGAVSSILLWSSLASAGPSAAVTLGVARSWNRERGSLPSGILRYLGGLIVAFLLPALIAGLWFVAGSGTPGLLVWVIGVAVLAVYQSSRSLGYAVEGARAVTFAEAVGAIAALLGAALLVASHSTTPGITILAAYLLGPVGFLVVLTLAIRRRIHLVPGPITEEQRRLARRAAVLFSFGAGSSMAMQYLPVLIANHLAAPTAAAILFGALQATTPLLLLSRVYGTVMMPALAASATDEEARRHAATLEALYVPSLALALGLAPWILLSLGLRPEPLSMSVAGLVALMTIMQVWATPAVTALSSRSREWIPAAASVMGLLLAVSLWAMALRTQAAILLPIGLALGGVVRSLVPLWLFSGRPVGFGSRGLSRAGACLAIALGFWWLGRQSSNAMLIGGTVLLVLGGALVLHRYRGFWRRYSNSSR